LRLAACLALRLAACFALCLALAQFQAHGIAMDAAMCDLLVALAIGLLIGHERERSKADGLYRRAAGIRTHPIAAITGAAAMRLGGPLLARKPALHRLVEGKLTNQEVSDGLVIALVGVVIWPLLPDRGISTNNAINPHMLGIHPATVICSASV